MSEQTSQIYQQLRVWQGQNIATALATVINTYGSCPRPAGSQLAVNDQGKFIGSVSGGCIEGAVISESLQVMQQQKAKIIDFDVADEDAWQVGLSCGGRISVMILPVDSKYLSKHHQCYELNPNYVQITHLNILPSLKFCHLTSETYTGSLDLKDDLIVSARAMLVTGQSGIVETKQGRYFLQTHASQSRLMLIGAVHIAQVLAPMAQLAGLSVKVIDPRSAFANPSRFPNTDLSLEWPDEALKACNIDQRTAIVTLTHDPKLDDSALRVALQSDAFYIGSLGSHKTHTKRVARLKALGLGPLCERIHSPVGLDLGRGARSPTDIAVSILAQIISQRHSTSLIEPRL
jgi:xanthine dehydrogenase accessory factor